MKNISNSNREPIYDFMFILDSEVDFNKAERMLYDSLTNSTNMNAIIWCNMMIDSGQTKYACEVPSPDRIITMVEIQPVLPYITLIQENPALIVDLKNDVTNLDISDDWKWLVSKLEIVDRNQFIPANQIQIPNV